MSDFTNVNATANANLYAGGRSGVRSRQAGERPTVAAADEASFGELLKRYRERAHLSQEELADLAGLSRRGISDLERGARRVPQRETTRRLVEALRLPDDQRARFLAAARESQYADASAASPSPSGLPSVLTNFIGRQREVEQVIDLLRNTRLLTLTGTGGIGKTRLALEVGRCTQTDFADGLGLADLSPLTDPRQVQHTVAAALGCREQPGRPIAASLVDFMRTRHVLLILDNCEHVLDASAEVADLLLRGCPDVQILATSRDALRVDGEVRWPLPPLAVPAAEERGLAAIASVEAVQLFIERARAVNPTFKLSEENLALVAELCRRLDGLPLAIELLATWAGVLPLPEIARRLEQRLLMLAGGSRTAQPRQQTLRASLDWSYELLSPEEVALFRRLAAFAGGWTLEAAEAICADDALARDDILATLRRLVDKSLILVEPPRYRFLETIRQYAEEKLTASDDNTEVRKRHAAYFVDLAARATSELAGPPTGEQRVDLESEHDNLRTTVRWVVAHADVDDAHVLGTALARFSQIGNHLSEGRAWLAQILALSEEPTAGRARTLIGAGLLGSYQGDYAFAYKSLLQGVEICRKLGEDRELAHGLFALGLMAWTRGDHATARALGDEGLTVSRRCGHPGFEALHQFICAAAAAESGDFALARQKADEARAFATRVGFGRAIGLSLGVLGQLHYLDGDFAGADSLLQQAAEHLNTAGIPVAVAWTLALRARAIAAQSDYPQAIALAAEALRLVRAFDLKGRAPFAIETLASILAHEQPEAAIVLASAAAAMRERMGVTAVPIERARLAEWLEPLRERLEPGAPDLWSRGQALSLEDTIGTALEYCSAALRSARVGASV